MNTNTDRNLQQLYAKVAGLSYVVFTLAGLIKNFLLNTRLSSVSNSQIQGMFANELHFRLGVAAEVVMFLAVIVASVSFYVVLKPIHKQMMQTALCLRLVEVIIGGLAVVASMTMLAVSSKTYFVELLDVEQLRNLLVIVSSIRQPVYEYSWIAMGFAGVITFYLFLKAHYIPRFWAVWGIITYSSLVLYPFAKILIADLPREAMFVMFPGALFELGVGILLLTKGIAHADSGCELHK